MLPIYSFRFSFIIALLGFVLFTRDGHSQDRGSLQLSFPDDNSKIESVFSSVKSIDSLTISGDLSKPFLKDVLQRLPNPQSVKFFKISDSRIEEFPEQFLSLTSLKVLELESCSFLDFDKVFSLSEDLKNLIGVKLTQNNLESLPKSINKLVGLKELVIQENVGINLARSIGVLTKNIKLTSLSVIGCNVEDIPYEICSLKSLEILVFKDNVLTEFPTVLHCLKNLKILDVSDNPIIISSVEELKKNKFSMNKVVVDNDLYPPDVQILHQAFPKSEISIVNSKANQLEFESSEIDSAKIKASVDFPVTAKDTSNRIFSVALNKKAYSDAYTMFPAFFRGLRYNFDSTFFEQRFLDTSYVRGGYRQFRAGNYYDDMALRCYKNGIGEKNETCFRFPIGSLMSVSFPELMAFSGMYWVYKGDLSKKQFVRLYKKKRFNDIRIQFNDTEKDFTITLKSIHGFESITAYPRESKSTPIERSQSNYIKRYNRYTKQLFRRSAKFQKTLLRNKKIHDESYKIATENAWRALTTYMGPKEKKMTREEWLTYYDDIISNESASLEAGPATAPVFSQWLRMNKFVNSNQIRTSSASKLPLSRYEMLCQTSDGTGVPIAIIYLINNQSQTFSILTGSLNSDPISISIENDGKYCMVAQTRSGALAYIDENSFKKSLLQNKSELTIKLNVLDKNLSSLKDLIAGLKLK